MNRSALLPVFVSRTFSKKEKALKSDSLPSFLRASTYDSNLPYETVYVPDSSLTVYPLVADALTCLPVYNGRLLDVSEYTRMGIGIKLHSKFAGTIVHLYNAKITYGSGSERDDNLTYRTDSTSAVYLKVGKSIQDSVKRYTPFTVTLPYQYKPDKIAKKFLGNISYWWVIMQYNGLIYPESLELELVIRIPDLDQVKAWLNVNQPSSSNAMQYQGQRVRL